ncbi:hypothetical protein CCZ01_04465 [Helicobacter monodelphidis]|uniref:hypothetical protein n=1 Tax=Helicobacter sp. 15-1451 TaxID=2004995 RepID=UPI000DCE5527|nr:hypothetical protein [Helicobacter sp. 15-1451]RAX57887.1 hypothetical protein CCZ01_04465 [Helicobacter sp. 15-1451]
MKFFSLFIFFCAFLLSASPQCYQHNATHPFKVGKSEFLLIEYQNYCDVNTTEAGGFDFGKRYFELRQKIFEKYFGREGLFSRGDFAMDWFGDGAIKITTKGRTFTIHLDRYGDDGVIGKFALVFYVPEIGEGKTYSYASEYFAQANDPYLAQYFVKWCQDMEDGKEECDKPEIFYDYNERPKGSKIYYFRGLNETALTILRRELL